jgi:hypothetical protein
MAVPAHGRALGARALPAFGVRVATVGTHGVATDAVGGRALIVTARAAQDVAPGVAPVPARCAGDPAGRVRVPAVLVATAHRRVRGGSRRSWPACDSGHSARAGTLPRWRAARRSHRGAPGCARWTRGGASPPRGPGSRRGSRHNAAACDTAGRASAAGARPAHGCAESRRRAWRTTGARAARDRAFRDRGAHSARSHCFRCS